MPKICPKIYYNIPLVMFSLPSLSFSLSRHLKVEYHTWLLGTGSVNGRTLEMTTSA